MLLTLGMLDINQDLSILVAKVIFQRDFLSQVLYALCCDFLKKNRIVIILK